MILKRKIFLIIFIGFLISSLTSFLNVKKYDQMKDGKTHGMIVGDIIAIWIEAEHLKKDLHSGKNFFSTGIEYDRTYLPSKLIALYSYTVGEKLFENFENRKIRKKNGKLGFLILQSLLYYFALFFFHKKILDFYNYDHPKCFFITGFLALEPTLIQWHSSFWTESIFLSLQLITLGLIIHKANNKFFSFIPGIFLGLMYLQKTVAMFFIFPVIFYLIISKKKHRIISIGSLIFGFSIILLILGYHNFKRSDIFYVTAGQSKRAHFNYLVPQIISKKNNIPVFEAFKKITEYENNWIKINNVDVNKEKDRRKLYNFQQIFALKFFLNNKITTTKIFINNTFHFGFLNPQQVYFWHKYNTIIGEEYHTSSDHQKWLEERVLYSLIVYFIVFVGIFYSFKKKKYNNFNFFIILSIFYYTFMLGWMGNPRYFIPSLMLISIFFGEGASLIFRKFFKYKTYF